MKITILKQYDLYRNPVPELLSRQAGFPGVISFPNGRLLALFAIGQAFESADMRTFASCSEDLGESWSQPSLLYEQEVSDDGHQFSEYYKPTLLSNGSVVAVGYAYRRPRPDIPLVNLEDQTFLPGENRVVRSSDGGQKWEAPRSMSLGTEHMLEISGPCIQLESGRLIAAGAEFTLNPQKQCGRIIYSDDDGMTWGLLSVYYRSPLANIAPWESRLCRMSADQIAIIFWAYDTLSGQHLTNQIVISEDGGLHWSAPVDTGIMAQASNLYWLGGERLLTLHCHRAQSVGLYLRSALLKNDQFTAESETVIWSGAGVQDSSQTIKKQLASLRFGQPSLIRLIDGSFLAVHWCFEDGSYVIKAHRLNITF